MFRRYSLNASSRSGSVGGFPSSSDIHVGHAGFCSRNASPALSTALSNASRMRSSSAIRWSSLWGDRFMKSVSGRIGMTR